MKLIKKNKVFQNMFKEMKRDREWFLNNYQKLVNDYPEEFIAIRDEKIIAHATDFENLQKKMSSQLKDKKPWVKYISKEGIELIL